MWVDAIKVGIKNQDKVPEWKMSFVVGCSIAMGSNVLTLFSWLVFMGIKINIFIEFDFLHGTMLDTALSGIVTLFLPFMVLNYLLIFHKDRYKTLLRRYEGYKMKGLSMLVYLTISVLLFIIPILVHQWLFL
jgi:hypothetical protein